MMVLLLVACVVVRVLCSFFYCCFQSYFERDEPTTPKENLNLVFARVSTKYWGRGCDLEVAND
jgi:hypothetical protein